MLKGVIFITIIALTNSLVLKSSRDGSWNQYIAYTPNDGIVGKELTPFDSETAQEILDTSLPIIILVHGHEGSAMTSLNPLVKNEILNHHEANVIVVDWSRFANRGYLAAVVAVPSVGLSLGSFITGTLVLAGFTLNDIHLIGFDLGAHVCGYAGRNVRQDRNAIAKITGLNPSGQYWGTNSGHLTKDDATLVEVIHTDIFENGIAIPIGHIDMYINRGRNQLGCTTHLCSHNRAYEIMAASISNPNLRGNQCETIRDVERNTCHGQAIRVGSLSRKFGNGIYRANTIRGWPYA